MLEISSDLRLDRVAVGDEVTAVLRSDVKRGKEVVVKKGATAKGRVIQLARTTNLYSIGLMFQDLEWKGGHAQVRAKLEGLAGLSLAGRQRLLVMQDGTIMAQQPRSIRGETVVFRTVR
jgi:hypothetical protein